MLLVLATRPGLSSRVYFAFSLKLICAWCCLRCDQDCSESVNADIPRLRKVSGHRVCLAIDDVRQDELSNSDGNLGILPILRHHPHLVQHA